MAITFTTTNNSATVTVTDANHGAAVGDFVLFRDVSGLSGANTATFIANADQPHRIVTVTTNTYTITLTLGVADGNNSSAGQASGYYYLEAFKPN